MRAIDLGMIQARRARLDQQIAGKRAEIDDIERDIEELISKLSELEIAERVFAELAHESVVASEIVATQESAFKNGRRSRAPKPPNLPAIPEMINEALRHAQGLGAPGLDPEGMTSFIRGRHWPSAPRDSIGPIAWRMWKRGELKKDDSVYSLPTAATQPVDETAVGATTESIEPRSSEHPASSIEEATRSLFKQHENEGTPP